MGEWKIDKPGRPLMTQISNLLGIRHFTISSGDSVRREFLTAVALAVGFTSEEEKAFTPKERLIEAIVRRVNDGAFDPGVLSTEGTVTNEALKLMVQGIQRLPSVQNRLELAGRTGVSAVPLPRVEAPVEPLDPTAVADLRSARLASIAVRDGQQGFRTRLLDAYSERCAITGFDAVEALEAAHIYPYRGAHTNVESNGLLLRADLHSLFDRGRIAVDETTLQILFSPELLATRYRLLADTHPLLSTPRLRAHRPQRRLLRAHREWAGLDARGT